MRILQPVLVTDATSGTGPLSASADPARAVGAVGIVGLVGTSVRVQVKQGAVVTYDQTRVPGGRTVILFEGLPGGAAPHIVVTIAPIAGGAAGFDAILFGDVAEVGVTAEKPTISITDFSRRDTDEFGVTTVVERGWSKKMAVTCKVDSDQVDSVQQRLAALRAKPSLWIADDRFDSLMVYGFFKDFSLNIDFPPVSYCSLTVEGLTSSAAIVDDFADPAPDSRASTLQVIRPRIVTSGTLVSSSIAENDHPEWSAITSYAAGVRVIKAATHRVYESLASSNAGNDPAGAGATAWLDVGPTNRWAMFDQAIGTASSAAGPIVITLAGGANALAILDTNAASVHLQAFGYDRTLAPNDGGSAVFADLPGDPGSIIVTISGAGTINVGTLIVGRLAPLGITEAAPTVSISDFSRKEADEFGQVQPVERAWAKRMEVRALVASGAADAVLGRIAALRATPSLWIGDEGFDSLTVYGFFRDFSLELGENVSIFSMAIEGLSTAAAIAAPAGIGWPDILDPDGTKPENGATRNVNRGAWVAGAHYDKGDNVTHGGSSYSAQVAHIAGTPPPSLQWLLVAEAGEDGLDGIDGLPGPPGANGTSTYVHLAYADSADGTDNFTTGDIGTRRYIGSAIDNNPADPGSPAAYTWSLFVGTNGIQGPPGADGQPTFIWIAYANNAAGTQDFTTGLPNGRTYIGVSPNQATATEGQDPAAYTWSLIKGADGHSVFTIVPQGATQVGGSSIDVTNMAHGWVTNGAYSAQVFAEGASLAFQAPAIYGYDEDFFVGINIDPASSITFVDIDYAFRFVSEGGAFYVQMWESGVHVGQVGWNGTSTYAIRYDGQYVRWFATTDGSTVLMRQTPALPDLAFGFDFSAGRMASIRNLGFGSAGKVGPQGVPGVAGVPGVNGQDGQTFYQWVAYADSADGTANFTTGLPQGRAYQGLATNKPSSIESGNPADYVWSPYRGPAAFGLVARGTCVAGPNYALKNGGANDWDSDVFSDVSYPGGVQVSASPAQNTAFVSFGINTDPVSDASYASVDRAFFLSADGTALITEDGNAVQNLGAYLPGDYFQVKYDTRSTIYIKNGVEVRRRAEAPGHSFYFDAAFFSPSARLNNIVFAPVGSAGADGANGVPGMNGADGQTLYTWVAYADALDGSANFTTGEPNGRSYQGLAVNKPTATESNNPADYAWAPYRGPATFGLVARGSCVVGPNYALKNGGSVDWGADDVFSDISFTGGCQVSASPAQNNAELMIGLNTDPGTDASYTSIDRAIYLNDQGQIQIYEDGSYVGAVGTYSPGDIFQVKYDNRTTSYYGNGNLLRSRPEAAGHRFYLDSAFKHPGGRLNNITWSAAGAAGNDGANGQNGGPGLPGLPGRNVVVFHQDETPGNAADGDVWITKTTDPRRFYNRENGAWVQLLGDVAGLMLIQEAYIADLAVGTLKVGNEAITILRSASTGTTYNGFGPAPSSQFQTVISFALGLAFPADVMVQVVANQSYTGTADFAVNLVLNGSNAGVGTGGGAAFPQASAVAAGAFSLGATAPGFPHILDIEWRGSAGIKLEKATLLILARYK